MASVTLQTRGKRGEGLQRCPSTVYCWRSVNVAQHAVCLGHCQWWGLFLTHLTDGVAEASVGAGEGQGPEPRTSGHRTPDPQPQELEACGGASVLSPQHPHAHVGIQPHSLNRGQPHPVVGDPGSQDPWYSGSQQQRTELGRCILSGTPHEDSHSSAPNLRHTALGCASSPQTPMAGWRLFSDPTWQGHVSPLTPLRPWGTHCHSDIPAPSCIRQGPLPCAHFPRLLGRQASPRFCMKLNKSSRNSFLLGSPSSS